jgi:hypothetical protein
MAAHKFIKIPVGAFILNQAILPILVQPPFLMAFKIPRRASPLEFHDPLMPPAAPLVKKSIFASPEQPNDPVIGQKILAQNYQIVIVSAVLFIQQRFWEIQKFVKSFYQ